MATETQSPEYKVIEESVVVHRVIQKDGELYAEVQTSGWVQIDGKVYGWETVAKDIPLKRISD